MLIQVPQIKEMAASISTLVVKIRKTEVDYLVCFSNLQKQLISMLIR